MVDSTFGSRLKQARELVGLTGTELAEKAGITRGKEGGKSTISNYEKGSEPKVSAVAALVRALPEINPRWLLTGEGSPLGVDVDAAQWAVAEIEEVLRRMKKRDQDGGEAGDGEGIPGDIEPPIPPEAGGVSDARVALDATEREEQKPQPQAKRRSKKRA